MCLINPPKRKKAARAEKAPRLAPSPSAPRYSRMPTRSYCTLAPSTLYHTDDYVDDLQQQYPDDQTALHHFNSQLGLHRLDDTFNPYAEQNHQATEIVVKGVQGIQDRLEKMEESLKETVEAADAMWSFCDDQKKRRRDKTEAKRLEKEDETRKEIEGLRELLKKGKATPTQESKKNSLSKDEMLWLLAERDTQQELERLRLKEHDVAGKETDGFVSETRLHKILSQRDQAIESQRLQAQQKHGPKEWLERPDLVKILDQRNRERRFARTQNLDFDKPKMSIKQGEGASQEQIHRRLLAEHEQRQEFERLKTFEAEVRVQQAKLPTSTIHPGLSEVGWLIDGILKKHDQEKAAERSRESLRSNRRRKASPRSPGEENSQKAIDEILSLLLHRQSVAQAINVLESLSYRTEEADAQTGRHWILNEVLHYLDSRLFDQPRTHDCHGAESQYNGDGFCKYDCGTDQSTVHPPAPARAHAHASPPPSYQSSKPNYTDASGARRWYLERPHVRLDPMPTPTYWERTSPLDQSCRPQR
ncbi:unnamed protein product [Discula destructiva]